MKTTKKRITVSLSPEIHAALIARAKDFMPLSDVAADLIEKGLEPYIENHLRRLVGLPRHSDPAWCSDEDVFEDLGCAECAEAARLLERLGSRAQGVKPADSETN